MEILTTKQAGEILGITTSRVRQLIRLKLLKADKPGRDFQIRRADLDLPDVVLRRGRGWEKGRERKEK